MVGQLVLLRHGIAGSRGITGQNDARALTETGRRKIIQIAPGLQKLLDPSLAWRIMTSPLPRAAQTAALLARNLKLPIAPVTALSDGDWPFVVLELAALSAREGAILVGHQPFLSDWSELMSGVALPFKKGAAAGYRLGGVNGGEATLRWFVQPGELIRLGGEA